MRGRSRLLFGVLIGSLTLVIISSCSCPRKRRIAELSAKWHVLWKEWEDEGSHSFGPDGATEIACDLAKLVKLDPSTAIRVYRDSRGNHILEFKHWWVEERGQREDAKVQNAPRNPIVDRYLRKLIIEDEYLEVVKSGSSTQ